MINYFSRIQPNCIFKPFIICSAYVRSYLAVPCEIRHNIGHLPCAIKKEKRNGLIAIGVVVLVNLCKCQCQGQQSLRFGPMELNDIKIGLYW